MDVARLKCTLIDNLLHDQILWEHIFLSSEMVLTLKKHFQDGCQIAMISVVMGLINTFLRMFVLLAWYVSWGLLQSLYGHYLFYGTRGHHSRFLSGNWFYLVIKQHSGNQWP